MNNKSAPKYYVPVNSQDNSNQKPREVEIRVIFLRIGDIDTLNEKFFAEILIESKWEEPKLVEEFTHIHNNLLAAPLGLPSNKDHLTEEKDLTNISRYWDPQIFIENALNDPKQTLCYKAIKETIRVGADLSTSNTHTSRTHTTTVSPNDQLTVIQEAERERLNTMSEEMLDAEAEDQFQETTSSYGTGDSATKTVYSILEYRKVKGSFFEKLELNFFPLDIQDLSIIITTFKTNKEVRLIENRHKKSIINSKITLDHHIWHLYQHIEVQTPIEKAESDIEDDGDGSIQNSEYIRNSISSDIEVEFGPREKLPNSSIQGDREAFRLSEKEEAYTFSPTIIFQARAARRSGYFFWNAYFLIFLITTSVFSTFSIDPHLPYYRLPTTATLLLTSITFRWSYSSRCLPTVNYLTSLDKYSISSMVIIYLCLIWHGLCPMFQTHLKANLVTLDRIFLMFILFLYIIIHFLLCVWMRSAYELRKELNRKDQEYKAWRALSNKHSIIRYMSHNNLMVEIDQKNQNQQHHPGSSAFKRASIFNVASNIDDFAAYRKYSKSRRLSDRMKDLFTGSKSTLSAENS